jgi:hypothetical protein
VGDSTTFGLGVTWRESWPFQLEELLNADPEWTAEHGPTEVINLAARAYGTDQSCQALTEIGLQYHPDLVIYHLCINDFDDNCNDHYNVDKVRYFKPFFAMDGGRLVLKRDYAPEPRLASGELYVPGSRVLPSNPFEPFFNWVQAHSAIAAVMHYRIPLNPDRWDMAIHERYRDEYAKARPLLWSIVGRMRSEAHRAGSMFLVTLSPTRFRSAADRGGWRCGSFLREYHQDARAAGAVAIESIKEYIDLAEKEDCVLPNDRTHLGARGNRFVAETTERWLLEHGVELARNMAADAASEASRSARPRGSVPHEGGPAAPGLDSPDRGPVAHQARRQAARPVQ